MERDRESKSGHYTRGWELFAHFLQMLRVSVIRHFVFAVLIGSLLGSIWFSWHLGAEHVSSLPSYAGTGIGVFVDNYLSSSREVFGSRRSGGSENEHSRLREKVFGGRTLRFLFKQWAWRSGLSAFFVFVFMGVGVWRYGQRMIQEKHLRGSVVREYSKHRWMKVRAWFMWSVLIGPMLGTIVYLFGMGFDRIAALPDYFSAWLSMRSSFVNSIMSMRDVIGLGWYQAISPEGFYEHSRVHGYLESEVFRESLPAVLLRWSLFALTSAAGGVVLSSTRLRDNSYFRLAGVPLPKQVESTHFLIAGSSGSGKTQVIMGFMDQVRDMGLKAIVYDASYEYIQRYGRAGHDTVLNVFDSRSPKWGVHADIRQQTDYEMMGKASYPSYRSGSDRFWSKASAIVMASTLRRLAERGDKSNAAIYRTLVDYSAEELQDLLRGESGGVFFDEKAGHMPGNLRASMLSEIEAWKYLPDVKRGEAQFSIREFVENDTNDSWLFLPMREDQRAVAQPLVSLWCDIAIIGILSLPESKQAKICLFLDELDTLQGLPSLGDFVTRGRKHGGVGVFGVQAYSQLKESFGPNKASTFTSQLQTLLALRTTGEDNSRWLEGMLSKGQSKRLKVSRSMGVDSLRDGISMQDDIRTESAVMASEIAGLPSLSGYLKLSGEKVIYPVKYPYKDRPKIMEPFVPRDIKVNSGSDEN